MPSHPFRLKPVLDQGFTNCMAALVGEKKNGNEAIMTASDILLLHDGRVSKNAKLISASMSLTKMAKPLSEALPRRLGTLKAVYNNREFTSGWAKPQREGGLSVFSSASALPDPVENIFILLPKNIKLPIRTRSFVDIGGDSRDRAWTGLSLRSDSSRACSFVSGAMLLRLADRDYAKEDMSEAGSEDDGISREESDYYDIFCWECGEGQARELFQTFDPMVSVNASVPLPKVSVNSSVPMPKTQVIDFAAGFSSALAAVRDRRPYRGYVVSDLLRSVLLEGLLLEICLAMQCQAPGFKLSVNSSFSCRTLSRAQSLGGDDCKDDGPDKEVNKGNDKEDAVLGDEDEVLSESGAEET